MKAQLFWFLITIFVISSNCLLDAEVEYIGTDEATQGDWIGKYGANGAILFAPKDLVDLKDIKYDDGGNQRWDWANPTPDDRGLLYPDDPKKRAGSCIFNNPVGLITIETKLTNYQVAVYAVDWDSSVRVEDVVGFQGNKAPNDPDVTVKNPDFHEGVYYLWLVDGNDPFKLQITHKGGANWVISGIFVDDMKGASVDLKAKLATIWGQIKQLKSDD